MLVYVKSMIQQSNDKLAPFKWYNHAPLGQISGCIKIDKMLKENFVSDDSLLESTWRSLQTHIELQLKSGKEHQQQRDVEKEGNQTKDLGTLWPQVTTTNSHEDMFQLEITVLQFCIDKILTSYLDLKMLNEATIWTSSLQLFFQEGWSCLRKIHDTTKYWKTCSLQMV